MPKTSGLLSMAMPLVGFYALCGTTTAILNGIPSQVADIFEGYNVVTGVTVMSFLEYLALCVIIEYLEKQHDKESLKALRSIFPSTDKAHNAPESTNSNGLITGVAFLFVVQFSIMAAVPQDTFSMMASSASLVGQLSLCVAIYIACCIYFEEPKGDHANNSGPAKTNTQDAQKVETTALAPKKPNLSTTDSESHSPIAAMFQGSPARASISAYRAFVEEFANDKAAGEKSSTAAAAAADNDDRTAEPRPSLSETCHGSSSAAVRPKDANPGEDLGLHPGDANHDGEPGDDYDNMDMGEDGQPGASG